ncbi:MAG: PIN domain-containing protein [Waltera sp.]|uniref:PIN domain-containing protein n=2 Tax=Waltera sp. TaxID=2815806 RepID=UPI003990F092
MAYYLIDFENVKSRGMEGVELLAKEDTVCIFYSDNADSMTFDLHRKLNETKAQIIYHKVAVGTKNALDFQLATYLGYLICEQQKEGIHPDYFIVTKDNGFTSLMVYWKAQGVPVRITRNLLWGKNPTAEQNPAAEEKAEEMTGSVEQENVQELSLEEAEPVAVDAEEIAEPAFVSVQILEEPLPEIGESVGMEPENITDAVTQDVATKNVEEPAESAKKSARKKSNNTRKKSTAKTAEKKSAEKKTAEKAADKKAAEEPDELAQAVEKVLSDQTIVPQVVKFIRQYKTKQGINNALNKEFKDSKRTSEIYSAIKPLIADKKGK